MLDSIKEVLKKDRQLKIGLIVILLIMSLSILVPSLASILASGNSEMSMAASIELGSIFINANYEGIEDELAKLIVDRIDKLSTSAYSYESEKLAKEMMEIISTLNDLDGNPIPISLSGKEWPCEINPYGDCNLSLSGETLVITSMGLRTLKILAAEECSKLQPESKEFVEKCEQGRSLRSLGTRILRQYGALGVLLMRLGTESVSHLKDINGLEEWLIREEFKPFTSAITFNDLLNKLYGGENNKLPRSEIENLVRAAASIVNHYQ